MKLFLLFALAGQPADVQVDIATIGGTARCTVRAEQASPQEIFGALMREARPLPGVGSLFVSGADKIPSEPLLDIHMTERPFGEVLGAVMGSVGLRLERRGSSLVIHPEANPEASDAELLERSRRNLITTLNKLPNTDVSARVLFSLARVEEKLGDLDAAQTHLRQLAEQYPESDLVPSALAKASTILQREGKWGEAKEVLADLCNLPYAHQQYPFGLLELARCHAQLSEGHEGQRVLDALDAIWPLEKIESTRAERAERLFVRAACLYEAGDAGRALVLLDNCNDLGHRGDLDPQVFPLRAKALEAVDRPADAAIAWLARSRTTTDEHIQAHSLREAARLALAADDQLAMDLIYARGVELGVEESLRGLRFEARARLGLTTDGANPDTAAGLLLLGRTRLNSGDAQGALSVLVQAKSHRQELKGDDLLELNILLGHAAHQVLGVDKAVAEMREGLSSLSSRGDRAQIYLLAAEFYEAAGRYDDAIDAYGGRL
ncbi:MAG: tetratricopeptide repeat protein [Planctomycetes bacterium]|nr:tetratricopeptide repeat protein [Planctomycetota bacterium]